MSALTPAALIPSALAPNAVTPIVPTGVLDGFQDFFTGLIDNRVLREMLPEATANTLEMVAVSALITVVIGLPLGLLLAVTAPGGLRPRPVVNRVLGLVVNIGRSLPFVILMIAIIPFTRWVVGTTLGWQAAVVPLSIAAIPFFARLVESAVREVSSGKIDAARAMGAATWHISWAVLFREALPGIIAGFTTTVISLISYSAMAGTIGAGGLGQLAISYGYQRFQPDVMIVTVVVILLIVQAVQMLGDFAARRLDHR